MVITSVNGSLKKTRSIASKKYKGVIFEFHFERQTGIHTDDAKTIFKEIRKYRNAFNAVNSLKSKFIDVGEVVRGLRGISSDCGYKIRGNRRLLKDKFQSSGVELSIRAKLADSTASGNWISSTIEDLAAEKQAAFQSLRHSIRWDRPAPFKPSVSGLLDSLRHVSQSDIYVKVRNWSQRRGTGNFNIEYSPAGRTYGKVYTKAGQILALAKYRKQIPLEDTKKPLNAERHFAVEIECYINANFEPIQNQTVVFDRHGVLQYVQSKYDGSLTDTPSGKHAREFVVCAPIAKRESVLRGVTAALAEMGAVVNKTCGLHVHLDARQGDRKSMYRNLMKVQPILYAMQPRSRQDNRYCKRQRDTDIYSAMNGDRYFGINPSALRKHQTIEVRVHAGTVDFTKILNYVDLLVDVAYAPEVPAGGRAVRTLASVSKLFPHISSRVLRYVKQRMDKFDGISNQFEESDIEVTEAVA